jgi:hypothetical protein
LHRRRRCFSFGETGWCPVPALMQFGARGLLALSAAGFPIQGYTIIRVLIVALDVDRMTARTKEFIWFRRYADIPGCTTEGLKKRARRTVYTPSADQSPIFGLGSAVGLAGDARHSFAVVDRDFPAPIRDQALFSQALQRDRHARAAHPEHER